MNDFTIKSRWSPKTKGFRDTVDARLCQVRINVGKEIVTSFVGNDGGRHDDVSVPGYYLAEWIAENWWPLLWEPRKTEDDVGQPDYSERHCLLFAQHGFALPCISITPTGDRINIYSGSRKSELATVRFDKTSNVLALRENVEGQLRAFVDDTISHMDGIDRTPLHEAWSEVQGTNDEEEVFFCRLIGSLGLSPYEEHPAIERALDSASSILSKAQLFDLCCSSTTKEIVKSALLACRTQQELDAAPLIDFEVLSQLPAPADIYSLPAFKTGYSAVHKLRDQLRISDKDVDGARKTFNKIGFEGKIGASTLSGSDRLSGVTQRRGVVGKVSIMPTNPAAFRFAEARATYLCWTSGDESRLITGAVTRDQQASRAFAAELLMPRAYVKSQAEGNRLTFSRMGDIADREAVAFETVKFQAQNAGLTLVR